MVSHKSMEHGEPPDSREDEQSLMAEQVLAAVRTAPGHDGAARVPDAGHTRRRRPAQGRGRRDLRHRREDVRQAAVRRPGDHGPRERRRDRQGRAHVHRAARASREGDRVFVEHYVGCFQLRLVPRRASTGTARPTDWRTNPDARRYGYTSADNPYHLWGGFAQYMYLPWNSVLHRVPGRRLRRAGRPGHPAVQRHRVGAGRRRASATTRPCSSRGRGSRGSPRSSPASRPAPR